MPWERTTTQNGGTQNICPGRDRPIVLVKIPETLGALQASHQYHWPVIPIVAQPGDEKAKTQDAKQQKYKRDAANPEPDIPHGAFRRLKLVPASPQPSQIPTGEPLPTCWHLCLQPGQSWVFRRRLHPMVWRRI